MRLWREQRGLPFAWGRHDCLTWAWDCAKAITGRDPGKKFRGRYKTAAGALKHRMREGCPTMDKTARYFFPEIPLSEARSGDWALFDNLDGTEGIGVVAGPQLVARGLAGLVVLPISAATKAYRVT